MTLRDLRDTLIAAGWALCLVGMVAYAAFLMGMLS